MTIRRIRLRPRALHVLATSAFILTLMAVAPAPLARFATDFPTRFSQQSGSDNPFNGVDVGGTSAPTLVDLDGDGDLDAIIGEGSNFLNYYENTGTSTSPAFTERTGSNSPFNGLNFTTSSTAPALADLDGDGDLDALIGLLVGQFVYFENTGTSTNPTFTAQSGSNNPLNGVDIGSDSRPVLADLDGDGDLDAILGERTGNLNYYENTGTSTSPTLTERTGSDNPFNGIDIGSDSAPALADLDGDGDLDAIIGEEAGNINYYENTGTSTSPTFTERTGSDNPFDGILVSNTNIPALGDLNGDGNLDAIIGEFDGTLIYFSQDYLTNFELVERTGTDNPFDGIALSRDSTPTLGDLDGDGDLDAIIGENIGTLNYYENTGTSTSPTFTERTGTDNPFDGIDFGTRSVPALVDLDGDGDLDAIIGETVGDLNYYENTGTSTSPTFAERTGTDNPFDGIDVGFDSTPTLGDLDGDGDLDAIIGEGSGDLNYYENTGTSTSPTFAERTGTDNPFDGIDVGFDSTPTLGDLDGDGDLDAIIGENSGTLNYYENTGTSTSPTFTERTGTDNPFDGIDIGSDSAPALADLDGDGDLDAIIGEGLGTINYFLDPHANGTFSAQIATPEGWHFLASPIAGQTYDNLLGGLWTMGFTGADIPVGDPSVRTYDESNTDASSDVGFTAISNQTDAIHVGQGFIAYVFQDNDLTTSAIDGGFPKTISLTGQETDGPFTYTLTYTNTGNANDDGWNLLGNPFGSQIDWDIGFTRTNVDGTVYVWDPAASAYKSWNGTTGELTNGRISHLQGFFVKANAASPALTLTTKAASGTATFYKRNARPVLLDLMVTAPDGQQRPTYLMFSEEGRVEETGPLDGYALTPLGASWLSLFTRKTDGTSLAINHLPHPTSEAVSIPLDVLWYDNGQAAAGELTLTWPRLVDVPEAWALELHDHTTGAVIDLRRSTHYTFSHQPSAGKHADVPNAFEQPTPNLKTQGLSSRFMLRISPGTSTSTSSADELPHTLTLEQNYPNPFNPTTTLRFGLKEAGAVRLTVYDLMGREIVRLLDAPQNAGWHSVPWDAGALASGVYVYQLEAQGRVLSRSMMLLK